MKNSRERKYFIYLYFYYFPYFFSLLMFSNSFFFFNHSCSFSRISISYSFRVSLLVINSLSFSLFENILISPSFLRSILTGYRILGWQFFSCSTWKFLYHFLMAYTISDKKSTAKKKKKSTAIWIVFPIDKVLFLFHWFQDFSLFLVSRILIIMCCGMDFFEFILCGIHYAFLNL